MTNALPASLAAYLDEVYGVEDPKEAFVKEHKAREGGASDAEYGTKFSGFSGGGPFSCKKCVHKKIVQNATSVCVHPKVNDDPELKDRERVEKFVLVDSDDCCRYVRPK